jgi:hypothetical protein
MNRPVTSQVGETNNKHGFASSPSNRRQEFLTKELTRLYEGTNSAGEPAQHRPIGASNCAALELTWLHVGMTNSEDECAHPPIGDGDSPILNIIFPFNIVNNYALINKNPFNLPCTLHMQYGTLQSFQ